MMEDFILGLLFLIVGFCFTIVIMVSRLLTEVDYLKNGHKKLKNDVKLIKELLTRN